MADHKEGQPSLLDSLVDFDVIETFKPLISSGGGWYIHPKTKKISPMMPGLDWERNWMFVNPDPARTCDLFQQIVVRANFIPSFCLDCWKVVVKMHTVAQLMKHWHWQKDFTNDPAFRHKSRFCKCGIEERKWVFYQYGAYFYCGTKEQMLERHQQVLEGLQDCFGAKNVKTFPGAYRKGYIEVIGKRYCTEFEIKLGPSDEYKRPIAADIFEEKIMANFDREKINPRQSDAMIEHILKQWLIFAWDRGDPTAMQFNSNKPYYSEPVTYHNQEE